MSLSCPSLSSRLFTTCSLCVGVCVNVFLHFSPPLCFWAGASVHFPSLLSWGFPDSLQQHGFFCSSWGRESPDGSSGCAGVGGSPLLHFSLLLSTFLDLLWDCRALSIRFCFRGTKAKFLLTMLHFTLGSQTVARFYSGLLSSSSN